MEDPSIEVVRKLLADEPYKLEEKLSEGSFAQVYEVVHSKNNQHFALKIIDLSIINKYEKKHQVALQIALLKRLNHPGIAKAVEILRWPQHIGIVMELGQFGDLFSFINLAHSKLSLQKRLVEFMKFYLAQALSAIDYLHTQGIVHRDIKPQNFVIGADLRLKMIDFGTAFVAPQSPLFSPQQILQFSCPESQFNQSLVGSANYLSPQSLQLNYTTKSDIWAFGILAYKFFYNTLPFQGSNNYQIFKQLTQADISIQKADHCIEELIVLCLKRDPTQRPTAKMLKVCSLFKGIDFKQLFKLQPPISKLQIQPKEGTGQELLFDMIVEKRMFFGNFKERFLSITQFQNSLAMTYGYLPSRKIKRSFPLSLNDFAQPLKGRQFQVISKKSKYVFRVGQNQSADQAVSKINNAIKKHFCLQ